MSIKRNNQNGVGLIEVLVAMLIVAVGAMGMLSLQLAGKKVGYDAIQRSIATALIHDVVERMRSNAGALDSYVVNNLGNGSISSEPSPNCVTAACTSAQIAAHDLWEWEQIIDGAVEEQKDGTNTLKVGGLVAPRACITHAAGLVTVSIVWKSFQETSNPVAGTCGEGLNLYGTAEAQRQIIHVTTFIQDV